MNYVFRLEGGLGKNFALLPSLSALAKSRYAKDIGFIAHYQQVFLYSPHFSSFHFFWNWSGVVVPSPYDSFSNFQVKVLEPYSASFFSSQTHIVRGFAKELYNILLEPSLLSVSEHDFFEWGFDDGIIKKKLSWLPLKEGLVLELHNRRHDDNDPRSLNTQQILTIIQKLLGKKYTLYIVSSTPYPIPNITYYLNGFIFGPGKPSIYYVYDVLELAYILKNYAVGFMSIDSFLPYLAHTTYVRENKTLRGFVMFFSTHPANFGFPENSNVLYNPSPSSRTFGLGAWDGYIGFQDLAIRNSINPEVIVEHSRF